MNILLDTLVDDASSQPAVPDTGPAVERMGWYLRALAKFLTEEPVGKVLLALIGEARHDPAMALVFHQRYLDPQRERERALLRRGITADELSAVFDIGAALDALCGPVIYRPLTGVQIPDTFIDGPPLTSWNAAPLSAPPAGTAMTASLPVGHPAFHGCSSPWHG